MGGILIAFQKYNPVAGMWGSKFIGMKNFEDVMKLADFKPALVNTLCRGDGRDGTISGFVTLDEDDCTKIYRLML
jgi:hypothetical protein